MADVIRKATNRFTKGLVMDFSPENTNNELLTHALNATLLTFNGNELSLQNDMGNARVETAYLPEGYMPVGTCEYGGIIYIVSYNPLENKSQIGCFPSPERNVSSSELGKSDVILDKTSFQEYVNGNITGKIKNTAQYVLLKDDNLNPGDKFLVCANSDLCNERLSDLWVSTSSSDFSLVSNPLLSLNIVSIEDSGKIVYLNSDIRKYEISAGNSVYKYHILGTMAPGFDQTSVDPDSYRNTLSSGYSVFKSKTSGKLALLAELVTIDSYSVTHSLIPATDESGNTIEGNFDVVIHTEVTPTITEDNKNIVPKLRYYFLKDSQGYVQAVDQTSKTVNIPLFKQTSNNVQVMNPEFLGLDLSKIYVPTYDNALKLEGTLSTSGSFDFPLCNTYHGNSTVIQDTTSDITTDTHTLFSRGYYYRLNTSQIKDFNYFKTYGAKFYLYNNNGNYTLVNRGDTIYSNYTYYIKEIVPSYENAKRDASLKNKTLYSKSKAVSEVKTDEKFYDNNIAKHVKAICYSYKLISVDEAKTLGIVFIKEDNTFKSVNINSGAFSGPFYKQTEFLEYIEIDVTGKTFEYYKNNNITLYYYTDQSIYTVASSDDVKSYWDFSYEYVDQDPNYGAPCALYYLNTESESYREVTNTELQNYEKYIGILYCIQDYLEVSNASWISGQVFMKPITMDINAPITKFEPSTYYNYLYGQDDPIDLKPYEKPIKVYNTGSFNPGNLNTDTNYLDYSDVKLANIQLPKIITDNGLDLPFKYDYTLVPCMSYGRLDHLAVSNTVDFSKLHAFNQSNFNTWKYHIDNNQLRLTFGSEIFDTYETDKVDALVLEFYDLWGFAGSLEISDKKSYTGIFTKIIPLNSLNAISKKRIMENKYITTYKRNINITETERGSNKFTFNGKSVKFENDEVGWRYSDGSELDTYEDDCGTLYSNVVYGVKAYLRRTKDPENNPEVKEFIEKGEFFLYTLPIYNDFYYTVNNFNSLTNPQLDFALTYKIKDSSVVNVYNSENIISGYTEEDHKSISNYLSGFSQDSQLSVTKFYNYTGTSEVYLEIGLKEDYQNLNISYSPDINRKFSSTLYLSSNSDSSIAYDVTWDDTSVESIDTALAYSNNSNLTSSINKLGFSDTYTLEKSIATSEFSNSNFINIASDAITIPIPIKYSFIVGYNADVLNIRSKEVPATTVCALLHKDSEDNYNYSDFGIYFKEATSEYLSSAMFYNGGTGYTEICGLCKLTDTNQATMGDECQSFKEVPTQAQDNTRHGKLNTGEVLKKLVPDVGKLTFCQPHAHAIDENNGVNFYKDDKYPNELCISNHPGDWKIKRKVEDTKGMLPTDILFNNPRYNMVLNTPTMIDSCGEFISTIQYSTGLSTIKGWESDDDEYGTLANQKVRRFNGLTSSQIASFNEKLINTMRSVYAYNPDYDTLEVNVGDVSISDKKVKFTSNLLNKNAKITFDSLESLNDFIYLGPICFSDYLQKLHLYSNLNSDKRIKIYQDSSEELSFIPQVQLVPGLDYCGESTPCLLTSITYNTPVPSELEDELSFTGSDSLVVIHHDGQRGFLHGKPNKNTLYGFSSDYNKLVALDVSNYTIDKDGNLKLKTNVTDDKYEVKIDTRNSKAKLKYNAFYIYETTQTVVIDEEPVDIDLEISLQPEALPVAAYNNNFFLVMSNSDDLLILSPMVRVTSSHNFSVKVKEADIKVEGKILDGSKIAISSGLTKMPSLNKQDYNTLNTLVSDITTAISFKDYNYSPKLNSYYWASSDPSNHEFYKTTYQSSYYPTVEYVYEWKNKYSGENPISLYRVALDSITLELSRVSNIEDAPTDVVRAYKTKEYYEITDKEYVVKKDYQEACLIGTSITINDLRYYPRLDGHRLYIRDDCASYEGSPRAIIYYRDFNDKAACCVGSGGAEHKNHLYLHTGPCFIPTKL